MNNDFNLLLKKQIIKEVNTENLSYESNPEESFYQEDYSSLLVTRKTTYKTSQVLDKYEEIKLELANLQVNESKALEHHKLLIDSYSLVESLIEHVLNHMECVFLETKSSYRLSQCLNFYVVHENCLTEEISSCLKNLSEKMDFSAHGEIKTKLLLSFSPDEKLQTMCREFEKKHANYKLALKNFKIILEILSVNDYSLAKLKQQFDEVLMDYQHCRCILDQELPFAISERTKLLVESLNTLAKEYDLLETHRNSANGLLKGIAEKLQQNEYILVKKEIFDAISEDL